MKTLTTFRKTGTTGKEGSALLMVLVVLIIVTGITTASLQNSLALQRLSQRQVWMEEAHWVAEAGLEEAARVINGSDYIGTVTDTTLTLPSGAIANIRITPLNNQGQEFSVHSTSTVRGITREIHIARVYRPTYLEYGNFYEDFRNLWWIFGAVVDGKTWTGTTQNIHGYVKSNGEKYGPIFRGINETAVNSFGGAPQYAATLDASIPFEDAEYSDLKFWNDHPEGYATGVSKPALLNTDFARTKLVASALNVNPDEIDPALVRPEDKPLGKALLLKGNTGIRFAVAQKWGQEVGIVEIRNKDLFGNDSWNELYSESLSLIFVENLLDNKNKVKSKATVLLGDSVHRRPNVLKGNLTVWAEDDVTIPDEVIYDNQNLEESSDKIAVISKDDIWIDRKFTGDMILQGGYIATGANSPDSDKGELGLVDYNKFGVRGTLYFTGSMVAQRVYPFGVFSGNSFVSGFRSEQTFDWRFVTNPPPFTPVVGSEVRYAGWY